MWRNKTVVTFLEWLHGRNTCLPQEQQRLRSAGFYGLDVYSLNSSMQTVIGYLERVDPEAAKTAKQRYSCFDRYVCSRGLLPTFTVLQESSRAQSR